MEATKLVCPGTPSAVGLVTPLMKKYVCVFTGLQAASGWVAMARIILTPERVVPTLGVI